MNGIWVTVLAVNALFLQTFVDAFSSNESNRDTRWTTIQTRYGTTPSSINEESNSNHVIRESKRERKEKKILDIQSTTAADRRHFLTNLVPATAFLAMWSGNAAQSDAACLSGDTSESCIGIYKLPLDDEVASFIDTPEHLAIFAPDLKWVPPVEYPKDYKVARQELSDLQTKVSNLRDVVLNGELTTAGTSILAMVPRITVAGRVAVDSMKNNKHMEDMSMKAYRAEVAHYELLIALGSCDVLIGQGIRGEMGSVTMTQIEVLKDLTDANERFNEFMRAVPEKIS